jgi:NAD(P)-dependent dehydrogenase (short-subunit alcohol dehydrogenase family)
MPPNASKELESISLRGENKTAVIIGATTGIGAAVARLYAKLGCSRVIVFGRNEARGEEVCESMRGIAPEKSELKVEFVKGDVS